MPEELGKEILVESAKVVAKESYKDGLQPTIKAVGSIIALPFQAIDAALARPKLWVAEAQYNFERTRELIANKMKDVPPEKIVPPENYVAVPALQQISYCFDSDDLREMYANLLASSMHADKKWSVHPGYVDVIKQLCPDEAKFLRYMSWHPRVPTIGLKYSNADGSGIDIIQDFSLVPKLSGCENTNDSQKYIDNLVRLGLLQRSSLSSLADKSHYEDLKNDPYFLQFNKVELAKGRGHSKCTVTESYVDLTAYGKSFCAVCLNDTQVITIKMV